MKICRNFTDNLENVEILFNFRNFFEFSRENSYFERIRMVRMVRMVRSLADRTFQLWARLHATADELPAKRREIVRKPGGLRPANNGAEEALILGVSLLQ